MIINEALKSKVLNLCTELRAKGVAWRHIHAEARKIGYDRSMNALKIFDWTERNRKGKSAVQANAAPKSGEDDGVLEPPRIDPAVLEAPNTEYIRYGVDFDKPIELTKEFAYKFLEMPEFVGERKVKPEHVEKLISEAKRNCWLAENTKIISCRCTWDGVMRRLNGQHTCWMRINMPDDWHPHVRHLQYNADTWEDFRRLYTRIDTFYQRSATHTTNARLIGIDGLDQYPNTLIRLMAQGMRQYLGLSCSLDSTLDAMVDGQKRLAVKVAEYVHKAGINGSDKKTFHLRRSSTVGAMLATFDVAQADAIAFWDGVCTGLNITSERDPRHVLRNWLIRAAIRSGALATQIRVDREEMYRACIHCWNIWRKNEQISTIRISSLNKRVAAR